VHQTSPRRAYLLIIMKHHVETYLYSSNVTINMTFLNMTFKCS